MNKYAFLQQYNIYLLRQKDSVIDIGKLVYVDVAKNGNPWFLKLSGYTLLTGLQNYYDQKVLQSTDELEEIISLGREDENKEIEKEINRLQMKAVDLSETLKNLRENETDPNVLKYLNR